MQPFAGYLLMALPRHSYLETAIVRREKAMKFQSSFKKMLLAFG
jgi:hypothetical protein